MTPRPLKEIETPSVLVDRDRLNANLDRMQRLATKGNVRLRPHVKTHKCLQIAELQLERGAIGVTASKVDEALMFIGCGVKSMTVAYPIVDDRKLRRLLAAAQDEDVEIRVVADSAYGVGVLAGVAMEFTKPLSVFLKIDVGLHRCGLEETDACLPEVARLISATPGLRFAGLLSHAGHAYAAKHREQVAAIAGDERAILQRVRRQLEADGIEVNEVSVGSTPTVLASDTFEGLTELRPGNYVFLDATALRLGVATLNQVALTVLVTIVSANDSYFIIDAGSKVLSSDLGAHGTGAGLGYGMAFPLRAEHAAATALKVVRLSEEHGFVTRGDADLPIGSKLQIVPNHACPVANLTEKLTIISGEEILDEWKVAARGCVR